MKIECTKEELLAYAKEQYQLGMLDDEEGKAAGIAIYIDEMFLQAHGKEENE